MATAEIKKRAGVSNGDGRKSRSITITEVAKLAGVSTATVSRVINSHPRVSPNIARLVCEAMASLEYVPSPPEYRRGRRPASNNNPQGTPRLALFALMVPEARSASYPSLLSGFSNAAAKTGREVTVCETENCIEQQAEMIIELVSKKVAGVAMVPTTMSMPQVHQLQLRYLQKENVPVVMLHRGVEGVKAPLIALPFEEIGYRAAQQLIDAGHRRIAYLALSSPFVFKQHVAGIHRALQAVDSNLPDELAQDCGILTQKDIAKQMPALEATLRQILTEPLESRPTAIICSFDYLAECVLDLLRRWGVSVPAELSIVSFGGAWRPNILAEQLSAVTVDEREVGQLAVDILSRMIEGKLPIDQEYRRVTELGFHQGSTIAEPASSKRLTLFPNQP
ncbi:MAG: LacI family DNA-binding transcriptional regulator [Pirellulales bacterium]|nr:LacI family DNA-binding transcriptional regulator [Pirellulales bacterium]